jgi:hypothetical protein
MKFNLFLFSVCICTTYSVFSQKNVNNNASEKATSISITNENSLNNQVKEEIIYNEPRLINEPQIRVTNSNEAVIEEKELKNIPAKNNSITPNR